MKYQILFSWKNNNNISKCPLLKILPRVLFVDLLGYMCPSKYLMKMESFCLQRFSEIFYNFFLYTWKD